MRILPGIISGLGILLCLITLTFGQEHNVTCARHGAFLDDDRACKMDDTTDIVCQNRGTCTCGQCVCNQRPEPEKIYGKYCECDNFSCERNNGILCSGPDHGKCECGICKCEAGWTGYDCGCSTLRTGCYEPGITDICSGRGVCECNRCKCNSTYFDRYSGRFCEKCPTCPDRCYEYVPCVQCIMFRTGIYADENVCQKECIEKYPQLIKVDVATVDDTQDETYCHHIDDNDKCRSYYVYGVDRTGKLYIKAQKDKECPSDPPFSFFWYIFEVVVSLA